MSGKKIYGPTRSELKIRLGISLAGLALMVFALVFRGVPTGPALFEVVVFAGLFFGGSAVWCARKLVKGEHSDGL